ncbi:MAG: tRNA (adenosine(37)-N6)-dimethylallyltransferase MiaA [Chloroflexi bacterium]|nr:tRNA (adenosine(37)-N6)-dimethylallyltransferase MiaA [Chloroflexota bacterium]MCL5075588.1 tRNA (adenosine(37)-N6)-dimethylallyltransferase MiaA [Chloroflexota bacterium]
MLGQATSGPELIALVGPTGVGKSELAISLAPGLNAEIVSADSRQIYRYMDIGTAKPTLEDQARVPHHLIDIVDPDEIYTLAMYQEEALHCIDGIIKHGCVPLLVGGTGLYVRAVVEGLQIPHVAPNPKVRAELEEKARTCGPEALYQELSRVDPAAAAKIDPQNLRRIIRALEVYHLTGQPISHLQRADGSRYRVLMIGLTMPREELYHRIDARVDRMIARGLVEEVKRLVAMSYGYELPAMSGLGYKQIGSYLRGEIGLDEAIKMIKYQTHRLARQQYMWFRLSDPKIRWLEQGPEAASAAYRLTRAFLSGTGSI